MSTVVPSSFVGVDSFDKTRSIFSRQTDSILQQIVFPHQRVNLRRGGGIVTSKQTTGVVSKWNWIVVVSTVVPSSFVGVDSFDKTRSYLSLDYLQEVIPIFSFCLSIVSSHFSR